MKKTTLSLLMILLLTKVYSNDSIKIEKASSITEAERIIDKYSSEISESFISIVESSAPHVKKGFEIVVRLQIAEGLIDNLESTHSRDHNNGVFESHNATFPLIAFLFFSVLLLFISAISAYNSFLHLLAPEWFALKEIIELTK